MSTPTSSQQARAEHSASASPVKHAATSQSSPFYAASLPSSDPFLHTERSRAREEENRSKVVQRKLASASTSRRTSSAGRADAGTSAEQSWSPQWDPSHIRPFVTPPQHRVTLRESKRLPSGTYRQVETEFIKSASDVQKRLDKLLAQGGSLQTNLSPDKQPGPTVEPWHKAYPAGSDIVASTGDGLTPAAAAEAAARMQAAASQLQAETSAHLSPRSRSQSRRLSRYASQAADQHLAVLHQEPRGVHLGSIQYSGAPVVLLNEDTSAHDAGNTNRGSLFGGASTVASVHTHATRQGSRRDCSTAQSLSGSESLATATAAAAAAAAAAQPLSRAASRALSTAWGDSLTAPIAEQSPLGRAASMARARSVAGPGALPIAQGTPYSRATSLASRYDGFGSGQGLGDIQAMLDQERADTTDGYTYTDGTSGHPGHKAAGYATGTTAAPGCTAHNAGYTAGSTGTAAAAGYTHTDMGAYTTPPSRAESARYIETRSVRFSLKPLPEMGPTLVWYDPVTPQRSETVPYATAVSAGKSVSTPFVRGAFEGGVVDARASTDRLKPQPLVFKESTQRVFAPGSVASAVREVFRAAQLEPALQGLSHRERLQAGIRELNAEFFGPLLA